MKFKTATFDLRPIDFQSNKRLALPNSEKIRCECCGRKIAKGVVLNTGEKIGTECAKVGRLLQDHGTKRSTLYSMQISEKQVEFFGFTVTD